MQYVKWYFYYEILRGVVPFASHLNFTLCFIGLVDVTDVLYTVGAFVSHWLFLSLIYCCIVSDYEFE